jgi:flagellar hook-length control protein FliK
MQIFPLNPNTAQIFKATAAEAAENSDFPQIFSSFIKKGRTEYCGLPEGFSSLAPTGGTLSKDAGNLFRKELEKLQAPQEALEALDQMSASGLPLTVGRIFSALSGQSRASAPLEGEDRLNFTQLLGKWGFTRDEAEEILDLSDAGRTVDAWKRMAARIRDLGGEGSEAHVTEISALLKGLDMPEETRARILQAFEKTDSLTLTGQELETLLGPAAQKAAARGGAQEAVQPLMREAMALALAEGRRKERNDPVADARGSRRSEQSQTLMLHSVREKAGEPLENAGSGREEGKNLRREGFERAEAREEGRERTERTQRPTPAAPDREGGSSSGADREGEPSSGADKPAGSALDRLLQRIDAAGAPQGAQNPGAAQQAPAQDLNSLARNFRQEIFSQVENGFLQQAQNGGRQLTLQLNPQDLGQITLILSVHQGEVRAQIRAEQGETAAVLTERLAELKASLEAQGLKVKELDVQTQMQNNEFSGQWNGEREHNLMQDAQERARMIRLSHLRRDTGEAARTIPASGAEEETGLHIVA